MVDKASSSLASIDGSLKRIADGFNKNNKAIGGMNKQMLGLGLGMTFFMWGVQMQLQRMLRSMFNTFTLAEGETGALNQQFNIVRANLAAISIAFFDAFAQSGLFDYILNFVVKAADWFLNLSDATREWIASFAIKSLVLLIGIQMAGQTILAINTLGSFFDKHALPQWKKSLAGGLVLSIALDLITSIKDFVEGNILKGLLNALEAVAGSFATYGLVTGKMGIAGTFFTLLVGLKLIEQGVFFKSLIGVASFIYGVFEGLLVYAKSWAQYLGSGIYNAIKFSLGLMNKEDYLATVARPAPDFTDILDKSIRSTFSLTMPFASRLDTYIAELINSTDKNTEAVKENTQTTPSKTMRQTGYGTWEPISVWG